jgi:hypothetical protein
MRATSRDAGPPLLTESGGADPLRRKEIGRMYPLPIPALQIARSRVSKTGPGSLTYSTAGIWQVYGCYAVERQVYGCYVVDGGYMDAMRLRVGDETKWRPDGECLVCDRRGPSAPGPAQWRRRNGHKRLRIHNIIYSLIIDRPAEHDVEPPFYRGPVCQRAHRFE